MNRLRCLFLGAIVVISSSTLALGGEMQVPGKSDSTPTPGASTLTTTSTSNAAAEPTSSEKVQSVFEDATTMLVEILLTIF